MTERKYLVGPISAQVAWACWKGPRERGLCRAFNPLGDTDLTVDPVDSWDDVCRRLPDGWRPDFVVVDCAYTSLPGCLWQAPVPLVALAADWPLLWHHYRRVLPRCELVLTDTAGVEVMRRQGFDH